MARAANAKNALDRVRDVSFALDQLEILNKTADFPLRGKLDLQRVGMTGHSFGANTTLMACGLKFGLPGAPSLADSRIKAAIAMSAPSPQSENYDAIYGSIKLPMLHLTGTKDESPLGLPGGGATDRRFALRSYSRRRIVFNYLQRRRSHGLFRQRRGAPVQTDARYHALIQQSTTAFWDAYLRDDAKALAWLKSDSTKELGNSGVFEKKP